MLGVLVAGVCTAALAAGVVATVQDDTEPGPSRLGECIAGDQGGRGSAVATNRTGQREQWVEFRCDDGTVFTLVLSDSDVFNLIANPVLNDILPLAEKIDG